MNFNTTATLAAILGFALIGTSILPAADVKSDKVATTQPSEDAETVAKKISLAEFETMRAGKDVVVLDVRTPKEFAAGHVPGAVNIDWHSRDFNAQVEKLDKSKKYLVHCHAGTRSAAAAKRMGTLEFKQLFDFSGGWAAYEKAGKTIEK